MAEPKTTTETTLNSESASQRSSELEKGPEDTGEQKLNLDRVGETQGYVLDEAQLRQQLSLSADAQLKTAKDGKTVLIPQVSRS